MENPSARQATWNRRRWREIAIVFAILVLLGLSYPLEFLIDRYHQQSWETLRTENAQAVLDAAENRFSGEQRTVRRLAVEIGQQSEILSYLSGETADKVRLFLAVEKFSSHYDIGVEVYDRNGDLIAWHGLSGPQQRREVSIALDGQMTSYVTQTPVASQLFLATPVRSPGRILGVVVVRKTIDVHYPFSNRFVTQEGITRQVTRDLAAPVQFDFSTRSLTTSDSAWTARMLYGIDSSVVGAVQTTLSTRTGSLERIKGTFDVLRSILLAALAVALFVAGKRLVYSHLGDAAQCFLAVLVVWFVRYGLLWVDLPAGFLNEGIFDPGYFASQFGGGLAKSLGEMTLTVAALAVSVFSVLRWWAKSRDRWEGAWKRLNVVVRCLLSGVATVFLFWVLRGYGAVVHSAVFDSTLPFYEPTAALPSFELAVMLLNLLLLGSVVVVLGVITTQFLASTSTTHRTWFVVIILLYATAAIVLGMYEERPLMTTGYRLGVAAFFLLGAWWFSATIKSTRPAVAFGMHTGVLVASAVLLYPLLAENSSDRDRSRVEQFAAEVLRPVDHWFTFVVDEALQRMRSEGADLDILQGRAGSPDQVVFGLWARSVACREGYTSVFEVLSLDGRIRGRFAIGSQTAEADQVLSGFRVDTASSIRVKTLGEGTNAVNVYAGSAPILDPAGIRAGLARVAIAAGRQALFRGENPPILRGTSKETLDNFYRTITLSEFRGGLILSSTSQSVPLNYALPAQVRTALANPAVGGIWIAEEFLDKRFETLYLRKDATGAGAIALSMEERGIVWVVIGAVKILMVLLGLLLAVGVGILILRYVRGIAYQFTFRDRLLGALLATAIVPFVVLLWYGEYSAKVRVAETTAQRLEQQTERIAQEIREYMERGEITIDGPVTPDVGDRIASSAGADFNLYLDNVMTVTSRPELYAAGLLDARVSGGAFATIALLGQKFYAESPRIGRYRYAVGYRPVLDRGGAIIGIVSVPTLYRQEEVERENAVRMTFLYAVYTIVLFGVLLLTTLLANRIAAPIVGLTRVTKRVAKGDLDISGDLPTADGEIGELVRSFEAMTQDLRRSRDSLVRVERELAWKEMARQVAHEIKNPLTPMRLMVQHLRQTYRDKAPNFGEILDQVTRTIIDQIDTLTRIASEFSSFARMPKRNPLPCDVSAVIREAIALFDQEKRMRFSTTLDDSLPPVMADREELRRAFINIIRNGIQAMNGNGVMELHTHQRGSVVVATVRDYGTGISDEVKARLFQPNFSTKTDGMGLGLAIVKKTVDDLGGTIGVESVVGRGTTVTIELPYLREAL